VADSNRVLRFVASTQAAIAAVFTIDVAIAAIRIPGTVSAPIPLIAIYALFACTLAGLARALGRQKDGARTPLLVAQLFGLVVGATVFQGDGAGTKAIGFLVLLLSLVGLLAAVRTLNPAAE
jgi:hypothetical protein